MTNLDSDSGQRTGFVRVAHEGGQRPPDDPEDADGICEWLEDRKIILMEWQNLKEVMDSARKLDIGGKDDELV
jgi:hypothetical protein